MLKNPPLNRNERIKLATRKIEQLKPKFEKAKLYFSAVEKEFKTAEFELAKEIASFDIGEKVRVVTKCDHGCCVENDYEGIIVSGKNNGGYSIEVKKEYLIFICNNVCGGDMTRVG